MTSAEPSESWLSTGPAERIAVAVKQFGETDVVERSVALLAGFNVGEEFLLFAGGTHAKGILDGAPPLYWPEVWGARALLHVWDDSAKDAVVAGLANQAWRVREMCAKVVALRRLPVAAQLRSMLTDPNSRVRTAAARALAEVGVAADADAIARLFKDPDIDVRRGAGEASKRLMERVAN
jgi:HEAT repeats